MGSFWNETTPQIISISEAMMIRNRCERAKETMRAIMPYPPY